MFDNAPQGPFSLNLLWDRAIARGRLFGLRLDGSWMHVGTPESVHDAEQWIDRSPPSKSTICGLYGTFGFPRWRCTPWARSWLRASRVRMAIQSRPLAAAFPGASRLPMTLTARANIYTVEAGRPFLDSLASALLDGRLPADGGPCADAASTRSRDALSADAARDARVAGCVPARCRWTGVAVAEDRADLGGRRGSVTHCERRAGGILSAGGLAIAPAIGELDRRLVLTSLIRRWTEAMHAARGADEDA